MVARDTHGLPKNRFRKRGGRCYELCAKLLLNAPDGTPWELVHGKGMGMIRHAFLERDGLIYDAVDDKFFQPDDYRRQTGIVDAARYTHAEAARHMAQSGHCGPWNGDEAS